MNRKNFKLIEALSDQRMTQAELVRAAGISSEARLSRIIGYQVRPTTHEARSIAAVLKKEMKELGIEEQKNDD